MVCFFFQFSLHIQRLTESPPYPPTPTGLRSSRTSERQRAQCLRFYFSRRRLKVKKNNKKKGLNPALWKDLLDFGVLL